MIVKLLLTLSLFLYQLGFSQAEKPIKGKVSSDNFLLQNVDVINITSKTSTSTSDNGEFIIQAKANDSIYFYAKEYHLKKIKLSSVQVDQNNLDIIMFKKPEELEEVVITKIAPIKVNIDKVWEQEKRDEVVLDKAAKKPRTGVYDGSIENGMDFMRIGKIIAGLFSKGEEKEEKKEVPKIEFENLAKNTFEEKFYLETLKLKPDEINLFLQFCDTDPKSKKLIVDHNKLSMMDFLMAKNKEFKKLQTSK